MNLIKTFRMIFDWFRSSPNSAIVFGNDVICNCWAFKLAYFVEHELSALKVSTLIHDGKAARKSFCGHQDKIGLKNFAV